MKSMSKFRLFGLTLYIYCTSAYLSLYLLSYELPTWLENAIVGYALTLQIMSLPLLSILTLVNGTDGQWQVAPNFWGVIVVTSLYVLSVYCVLKLFNWIKKKA